VSKSAFLKRVAWKGAAGVSRSGPQSPGGVFYGVTGNRRTGDSGGGLDPEASATSGVAPRMSKRGMSIRKACGETKTAAT